jgi:aspartate racemase
MDSGQLAHRVAGLSPDKRALLERHLEARGPAIPRRATRGAPPLSFAQQRLWFIEQLEPRNPLYHITRAVRLRGSLDIGALQAALDAVVARHEAVRTTFQSVDGSPVQRVGPPRAVTLARIDLGAIGALSDLETVRRRLVDEAQRPYDLSRDLMLRAALFRFDARDHVLLLMMHHIATDAWSMGILARELSECYAASVAGRRPTLPDLPIQYGDYAEWQRQWFSGSVLEKSLRYWTEHLANLTPLELPTDHPRPARQTYRGGREAFRIPSEITSALRAVGRQSRATLFMTIAAAFQTLLHRYSGQEDIAVGTPIAGRGYTQLEGLIGFFVNTLVLRGDLSGNPTFRKLLAHVRDVALRAYEHQDLPFERLVAELGPARSLSHTPVFQVMLAFNSTEPEFLTFRGVTVEPIDVDTETAKCDLILAVRDTAQELAGRMEYNTDLFESETIRRMLGHFETLLAAIAADPDRTLSALPLLSARERRQLIVEWNDTRRDLPADRVISELFEDRVREAPDRVAVEFEDQALTYAELDRRANRLAHHLRALGVGPEVPVALCVERSLEMIVGLLGILKAGGAYVPLDPSHPKQWLAFILDDTRAPVVLTLGRLRAAFPDQGARVLCLDADWPAIEPEGADTPVSCATPDNLAYVMYTSGSTGHPKGVCIPQRAVVRLVKNANYARLDQDETFLQLAPLAFDASTFEIWGSLLNGARLAICPPRVPSVADLGQVLRRHRVTTLWLTAALFHQVVDEDVSALDTVRQLLAGGDVLSVPRVNAVLRARPDIQLINGYGPTETTTFACCFHIPAAGEMGSSVPIGRPIANTRVYVLDRHRQPVPVGVPGELYIGDEGVARGYLNRPDLTAERFLADPFADRPGARLYRTGDLVRYRADGVLEFLGRIDDQVKIRGFRVEPSEIEAALREHPSVREVAVVARADEAGEKSLVAYLETSDAQDSVPAQLRRYLGERLPAHMVPSAFVRLPGLPLTSNGKVDRQALRACGAPERASGETSRLGARNAIEARLVEIWEEVLRVQPIGITDDFFQLGGHSLLAVQIFARLRERLGVTLPLATLFEAPTIAQLVSLIGGNHRTPSERSLVAIQPAGDRPPLFGVPGVGGNVLCYGGLAWLLGPDQPFYGLQSLGLDGSEPPLTRIEDIAEVFARDIRTTQPEGPYYLAGTCMGGVVAWEIAQQLRAAGQEVGLLALLDTWPPTPGSSPRMPLGPRGAALLEFVTGRVRLSLQGLRQARGRDRVHYLRERMATLATRVLRRDLLRANRSELDYGTVSQANLLAFQRYELRAYAGAVVLFRAEDRPVAEGDDPSPVWRQLATGDFEVHAIPAADSGLMLVEPNVGVLAKKLRECLGRAQGR